jgi:hypothetical protein
MGVNRARILRDKTFGAMTLDDLFAVVSVQPMRGPLLRDGRGDDANRIADAPADRPELDFIEKSTMIGLLNVLDADGGPHGVGYRQHAP